MSLLVVKQAIGINTKRTLGLWWLGASFLVAGSVIIGRRDEGVLDPKVVCEPAATVPQSFHDEPDAPLDLSGTGSDGTDRADKAGTGRKLKKRVSGGIQQDEL